MFEHALLSHGCLTFNSNSVGTRGGLSKVYVSKKDYENNESVADVGPCELSYLFDTIFWW
jgi:hypothetical protein